MNCPKCGGAVSYCGATKVECGTVGCGNYVESDGAPAENLFSGPIWYADLDPRARAKERFRRMVAGGTDDISMLCEGGGFASWYVNFGYAFEGKIPEGKALLFGGPRHGELVGHGSLPTIHYGIDQRDVIVHESTGFFAGDLYRGWHCEHCDVQRIGKLFAGTECGCLGSVPMAEETQESENPCADLPLPVECPSTHRCAQPKPSLFVDCVAKQIVVHNAMTMLEFHREVQDYCDNHAPEENLTLRITDQLIDLNGGWRVVGGDRLTDGALRTDDGLVSSYCDLGAAVANCKEKDMLENIHWNEGYDAALLAVREALREINSFEMEYVCSVSRSQRLRSAMAEWLDMAGHYGSMGLVRQEPKDWPGWEGDWLQREDVFALFGPGGPFEVKDE